MSAGDAAAGTAVIFTGQGTQTVGMGKQLYDQFPRAQELFKAAEKRTDLALRRICFEGPPEALNDTAVAQPAIFLVSYLLWELIREAPDSPLTGGFAYTAGHSLGEYAAAVAAGSLDPLDAVGLVADRGRFMRHAGKTRPGGMAAVIGMSREDLEAICDQARGDGVLLVANDNSPKQQVISGEQEPLERASQLASEAGGRVIRLDVTIASHSALMDEASARMAQRLRSVEFAAPEVPVVSNMKAQPLTDGESIRQELSQHTAAPVRWTDSVRYLSGQGVSRYVEIGPRSILSRLVRQTAGRVETEFWGEEEVSGLYA